MKCGVKMPETMVGFRPVLDSYNGGAGPLLVEARPVSQYERGQYAREHALLDGHRPASRAECEVDRWGVCPLVSCRWHLYLDVLANGKVRLNFPTLEVDEIPWSCALDLADAARDRGEIPGWDTTRAPSVGSLSGTVIARALNLSVERVRQVYYEVRGRLQDKVGGFPGVQASELIEAWRSAR